MRIDRKLTLKIGDLIYGNSWPPSEGVYHSKIILNYDDWNDYNYRTSFCMYYCDDEGKVHEIGNVKIYFYENDEMRTNNYSKHTRHYLDESIEQLGVLYCSLGQEVLYIRNIGISMNIILLKNYKNIFS